MAGSTGYSSIATNGLVFAYDINDIVNSYRGEPTTNLLPGATTNALPTYGNGWGTYNTNQYCGNNGCAVYWTIPAIASVSSNIITTVSAHQIRTYDVINPNATGGGVTAGTNYLAKKISDTQFSLHAYNGSQDGSQGYTNSSTGFPVVWDSIALDQRISVNASGFPTGWWGAPHLPNSGLVKEIIPNGYTDFNTGQRTDCIRLKWIRPDGVTDGMAYGVDAPVTIGSPVNVSFYTRAVTPSAVGQSISFQNYNYGGPGGASGFSFGASWGAVGEWVRNSYSFTPTHNTLISYWFPSTGNMMVDIANIQIEQKNHTTPFTTGTRSSTQGLLDLSPTKNILTLGNSYDSNSNFYFDGTDDYINIPHNSAIAPSTGYISVEAIFKAASAGSENGSIIYNKENEYEMSAGGGYISYAFRPNWAWVGSTAFNTNQWYHTMLTYDQSYQRLYVNGVQVYSAALSGAIGNVYSEALRIGARGGNGAAYGFFNGQIPVVKVYNRALSAGEVKQNYNHYKTRYNLA